MYAHTPRFLVAFLLLFTALGWSGVAAAAGRDVSTSTADTMLQEIGEATTIDEGTGPHVVYIFFDPNCPYCHKLYERLRPWVKRGGYRFRWIPVGILTPTSPGKAAALLDAPHPLEALRRNESGFDTSGGLGGIEEALGASPRTARALKINEGLLAHMSVPSVPAMLFRADNGRAMLVQGAPPARRLARILRHVM